MRLLYSILLLALPLTNSAQSFLDLNWAHTNPGRALSVCSDKQSNHYFAGFFLGTADFDPGSGVFNMTANGNGALFIQKLDQHGNFLWAKSFQTYGIINYNFKMLTDQAGNVFLSGSYIDSIELNPAPQLERIQSNGIYDFFVLKLDRNGQFQWARSFGGPQSDFVRDIFVDNNGGILLAGEYRSSVDFDPGPGSEIKTSNGMSDLFVLRLNSNGNFDWVYTNGAASDDDAKCISIDNKDNIVISGTFSDSLDFDIGTGVEVITAFNLEDSYILKLNQNRDFVWVKTFPNFQGNDIVDVRIDKQDNILIGGTFAFIMGYKFTPPIKHLASNGGTDGFGMKLDSNANVIFAKNFGGWFDEKLFSMDIDNEGNMYFTGAFRDSVDFDPGIGDYYLHSKGGHDFFVSRLNNNGEFNWAISNGGRFGNDDIGYQVSAFPNNELLIIGNFFDLFDADPDTGSKIIRTSSFRSDAYAIKYSQNSCASLVVKYDSVKSITCTDSGYVSMHVKNGKPPYSYAWNTNPVSNDSVISVKKPGIYTVNITDGRNCNTESKIILNGPRPNPGFDFDVNVAALNMRSGFDTRVWLKCLQPKLSTPIGKGSVGVGQQD